MKWMMLLLGLLFSSQILSSDIYPFSTEKKEAQFQHLLSDLRCLVCQNQDLIDSHATFAKDLRDEIYAMVQQGHSDDEIINYLTARFGDYILFKPPVKSMTIFLWLGPLIFLSLGLLIFWKTTKNAK